MTPSDPDVPQRRRVRAALPAGAAAAAQSSDMPRPTPKRTAEPQPYASSGRDADKQHVLRRLREGWLTIGDLTHLCCWGRPAGQALFERLTVSTFEEVGLPGFESRSRFVRREAVEEVLDREGWRVVRSQQDDPDVRAALTGNEQYPLLSRLMIWAAETPRRKLPLLDLALELGLIPSDAAFDLNREIDWADQAGLMRDQQARQNRLAPATRHRSRPTPVTYDDLIPLDEWIEGKPFKEGMSRILARQGRLEHLHAVMEHDEVVLYLLPRWAEILAEPEEPTCIKDYEPIRSRMERTGESRQFIETAIELGVLKTYRWRHWLYVEVNDIGDAEQVTILQILQEQKKQEKIESVRRQSKYDANQTALLEQRLKEIEPDIIGTRHHERWQVLSRMATVGRLRTDGETLDACGEQLGVTRERVRQIHLKYERHALAVRSLEPRVIAALDYMDPQSTNLPKVWTRLLKAKHSDVPFALFNQIFIEHHLFGESLEGLYEPQRS